MAYVKKANRKPEKPVRKEKFVLGKYANQPDEPDEKVRNLVPAGVELFKIEKGVPITFSRGNAAVILKTKETVREIMRNIKVNESFVMPNTSWNTIIKMIDEEFPNLVLKSARLLPDKKFRRIWRVQ